MLQPWKLLNSEVVFHKYTRKIEKRDYKMPDGGIGDFYILAAPSGTNTLALTEDNKVITAAQYRPGPGKILNEMPGGYIDEGEDAAAAAARELLEETGYKGEMEFVAAIYEDAYVDRMRIYFIATGCKKVGEQQLDEATEFGDVVLLDLPDFIKQVRAGQMTDVGGAMLCLDHLKLL